MSLESRSDSDSCSDDLLQDIMSEVRKMTCGTSKIFSVGGKSFMIAKSLDGTFSVADERNTP